MKVLVVLTAFLAIGCAAVLKQAEECKEVKWEDWSECVSTKQCPNQKKSHVKPQSYTLEPAIKDHGQARMHISKQLKQQQWLEMTQCRNNPQCLDVQSRDNDGPIKCQNNYAGDFECDLVDQMSFLNFETLSGSDPGAIETSDIWGWLDPESGDEYAIVCLYSGTSFVRMTDPVNPVVVGYLPARTEISNWRDAKVIGNYVYIVSEADDHGMQVYDLTQLRTSTGFQVVEATVEYLEFGQAHNLVSHPSKNLLYVVGAKEGNYKNICNGGLHVVDVSDPLKPRFVTCFGADGYVHDAQCVDYHGPDKQFQQNEICFCYNEDSLTIVNVTDKNKIDIISKIGYVGYAYTHQGWLTEDQSVLLLDDEQDELEEDPFTKTYVWDVKSLRAPTLKSVYRSTVQSIDHNQYIKGSFTFQSNYRAGLRILHINQQDYELNEVAFFDNCLTEAATFNGGSWSNYPYFPSGNIALGSVEYGFFVVRPNMQAIEEKVAKKTFGRQMRHSVETQATTHSRACPSLQETRQCVAKC